ncbi:hypothetical protein [Myroides sp. DW712]|uniref:hypothetical protein n=1 Tax=Myroides sp. DW712 TaxID=3389800 RepID=UPI0039780586
MRRIAYIVLASLSLTLVQCKQERKEGSQGNIVKQEEIKLYKVSTIPYETNEGYSLKKQEPKQGVRHVKITNEAQFATLFNPSQERVESKGIDFSKSFVLALVGIPSTLETAFSIVSLKEKEDFIELTYCLQEEEKELAQAVYPYAILVVDKKYNKDIRFLIE